MLVGARGAVIANVKQCVKIVISSLSEVGEITLSSVWRHVDNKVFLTLRFNRANVNLYEND